LSGAILDTGLMQPGGMPIVSIHGTADDVVPYDSGTVSLLGMNIIDLQGSSRVHQRATQLGIDSRLWSIPGADHYPQDISTATRDSMISYVAYFLYDYVDCQSLGIASVEAGFRMFPNPSAGVLHIQAPRNVDQVRIMNMMGQSVAEYHPNESEVQLRFYLAEGLYLVECTYGNERKVERLLVRN
jgi:hypothetical protein